MAGATVNTTEVEAVVNTTEVFGVVRRDAGAPSDTPIATSDLLADAPLQVAQGTDVLVGNNDATVSMPKADTNTDGYLSSTDWNTFNNKQSNPTPPASPDKSVQFNDGGNFGGDALFTYDKVGQIAYLGMAQIPQGAALHISTENGSQDAGIYIRTRGHDIPGGPTGVDTSIRIVSASNHATGYSLRFDNDGSKASDITGFRFDSPLESSKIVGIRVHPTNINTSVDEYAVGAEIDMSDVALDINGKKWAATFKGAATNYGPLAADPAWDPTEGDIYYNSSSKVFRYYDGAAWKDVGSGLASNPGVPAAASMQYTGGAKYMGLYGHDNPALTTPDSEQSSLMARAGTLKHLYVSVPVAIGPGETLTATVYINGAPSALSATIPNSGMSANETATTISFNAGDRIDIEVTSTGGIASALVRAGILIF